MHWLVRTQKKYISMFLSTEKNFQYGQNQLNAWFWWWISVREALCELQYFCFKYWSFSNKVFLKIKSLKKKKIAGKWDSGRTSFYEGNLNGERLEEQIIPQIRESYGAQFDNVWFLVSNYL